MQIKRDFAGSTDMWPTSAGGQLIEVANLTGFTVYIFKFQTGHPLSVQVHVYKQKKVELQYKHKFILHVKPAIYFGYKYVAIIRLDVGS
jgi:hypothetical protein